MNGSTREGVLLVCLSALAFGVTYSDHAPLIPLITADLSLDEFRAGLLSTSLFFTYLVTTAVGVGFADQIGPKRSVALGLLAATAGTAVLAASPTYAVALAGKGLQGVGAAFAFISATRYIAALYGERRSHFALGLYGAGWILLTSLYCFANLDLKTTDNYFVGFPAIWNVVLLYLFALSPPPAISLAIVGSFVALTFVPLLAVHPFRVARLRALTCIVNALWAIAAAAAVMQPFPAPIWVQVLLIATAVYLSLIGFSRRLMSENVRGKSS